MKKRIILFNILIFLFAMVSMAQAVPMSAVGNIDTLLSQAKLDNSGDSTELAWVISVLGFNVVLGDKYNTENGDGWETVVGADTGVFAHLLNDSPGYFLIKTGNNTGNTNTHFLFENLEQLSWAVIDLEAMGFSDKNILNIQKISHIGEYNPNTVPEPSTFLLLGIGILLFGCIAGKRFKKNPKS